MNAIGFVAVAVFLLCALGALTNWVIFFRWMLANLFPRFRGAEPRPGLKVLYAFFRMAAFVIVGMLCAIVGIWVGHWPMKS
jgi:hypothetical protein